MPTYFNHVMLMGICGNDPELAVSKSGVTFCKLRVATSESYKTKEGYELKTDWHSVHLFDNLAEYASKFCKKGTAVLVEGRINSGSYIDSNGLTKYSSNIIPRVIKIINRKNEKKEVNMAESTDFQNEHDLIIKPTTSKDLTDTELSEIDLPF